MIIETAVSDQLSAKEITDIMLKKYFTLQVNIQSYSLVELKSRQLIADCSMLF